MVMSFPACRGPRVAGVCRALVDDGDVARLQGRAQQRLHPARPIAHFRTSPLTRPAAAAPQQPGLAPLRARRTYSAMTRRTPRPRAYAPDPDAPGRPCEYPGCRNPGEYRAPKGRDNLTQYWWYCLDHVRAYNASWDFYKGMTPGQIEAQMRADTQWQRPTWPLGRLGANGAAEGEVREALDDLVGERFHRRGSQQPRVAAPSELREPLHTLGLEWPVSLDAVKSRYKELAKRHHPDANGGDRAAEERLKTINLAYAAVRHHLAADTPMAAVG
jgi:hypothetical protein